MVKTKWLSLSGFGLGGPSIQDFLNIYDVLSAMSGCSLPLWACGMVGKQTKTYVTKEVNKM